MAGRPTTSCGDCPGDDIIRGGDGPDRLFGNEGADKLSGDREFHAAVDDDLLVGGDDNDLLIGDGEAVLVQSPYPPGFIPPFGEQGRPIPVGMIGTTLQWGNDVLDAGAGDDILIGDAAGVQLLAGRQ